MCIYILYLLIYSFIYLYNTYVRLKNVSTQTYQGTTGVPMSKNNTAVLFTVFVRASRATGLFFGEMMGYHFNQIDMDAMWFILFGDLGRTPVAMMPHDAPRLLGKRNCLEVYGLVSGSTIGLLARSRDMQLGYVTRIYT